MSAQHLLGGRLAQRLLHLLLVIEAGARVGAADEQGRRLAESLAEGEFELDGTDRQPAEAQTTPAAR